LEEKTCSFAEEEAAFGGRKRAGATKGGNFTAKKKKKVPFLGRGKSMGIAPEVKIQEHVRGRGREKETANLRSKEKMLLRDLPLAERKKENSFSFQGGGGDLRKGRKNACREKRDRGLSFFLKGKEGALSQGKKGGVRTSLKDSVEHASPP